jgi:hypothetical protein
MSVASDDSGDALAAAVAAMGGSPSQPSAPAGHTASSGGSAPVPPPPPLPPGILKVLVVGATGLDSLVSVGEQRPYYILEVGEQRSRSKPCATSGTRPVWNTAHKFTLDREVFAKVGRKWTG